MPKTRRLSDATLVRRSQQGDRRAFSALLGRYDWRLRGLGHALLLDGAEMDAALSVAYLRAWRDVVRINAKDDVGAWLYRVTYNSCIDQLRRTGDPAAAPASGSSAGSSAGSSGVGAGLATLSAADRVAIVLVDREGFSPASAARILGLSPAVLDTRLAAARERLAGFLPPPDPDGGGASEAEGDGGAAADPTTPTDGADTSEPSTASAAPVAVPSASTNGAQGNGQAESTPTGADGPSPDDPSSGQVEDGTTVKGRPSVASSDDSATPAEADGPSGGNGASATIGQDPVGRTGDDSPNATPASESTPDGSEADGTSLDGTAANGSARASGNGRGRRARRRAQHAATRPATDSTDPNGDTAP